MASFIEKFNPLTDPMFQILDPEGNCREELRPKWSDEELREFYRKMVFLRMADKKFLSLQRQGRMGTYPSSEGQEACQMGSAIALQKTDLIFPAFRELPAMWMHGVPLAKIFLYWMGNEWGHSYEANVAPVSIPVGTHMLHAVGFAWGAKMKKNMLVTLSYFSDGATSTGDFHEAMNFAGVFKVPTIFFCQNNQWAISIPRKQQTASPTLAQKALAYGFPGVIVDGNDLFAVYAVTKEAVDRARLGKGPTFIEAITYRFGSHTTSDDATKYRPKEEVAEWRKRDPLIRFGLYLKKRKLWDDAFEQKIQTEAEEEIKKAVTEAEAAPPPKPKDIFKFQYAELTPALKEQQEYLLNFLRSQGKLS